MISMAQRYLGLFVGRMFSSSGGCNGVSGARSGSTGALAEAPLSADASGPSDLRAFAEGVACCRAVRDSARRAGVELPITEAVSAVLFDASAPRDAVAALLAREPRVETSQASQA